MNKLKFLLILSAVLVMLLNPSAMAADEEVPTVTVNGETVDFDVQPILLNGEIMVPVRLALEPLGAEIKWNGETATVIANGKVVILKSGVSIISVKIEKYADSYPIIMGDIPFSYSVTGARGVQYPIVLIEGRHLVPISVIGREMGYHVTRSGNTADISVGERVPISSVSATQVKEYQNPPENILDSDFGTYWTCQGQGSVTAELGEATEIGQINLYMRDYGDGRLLDVSMEVSVDGENWSTVLSKNFGVDGVYTGSAETDAQVRYIRINCNGSSTTEWASVADLEIYRK